jgi:hypothetical protein
MIDIVAAKAVQLAFRAHATYRCCGLLSYKLSNVLQDSFHKQVRMKTAKLIRVRRVFHAFGQVLTHSFIATLSAFFKVR